MFMRLSFLAHPKHCNEQQRLLPCDSQSIQSHYWTPCTAWDPIPNHNRQCLVQGPAILTTIIRYHPTHIPLITFHLLHYASLFHPPHVILHNTPFNLPWGTIAMKCMSVSTCSPSLNDSLQTLHQLATVQHLTQGQLILRHSLRHFIALTAQTEINWCGVQKCPQDANLFSSNFTRLLN